MTSEYKKRIKRRQNNHSLSLSNRKGIRYTRKHNRKHTRKIKTNARTKRRLHNKKYKGGDSGNILGPGSTNNMCPPIPLSSTIYPTTSTNPFIAASSQNTGNNTLRGGGGVDFTNITNNLGWTCPLGKMGPVPWLPGQSSKDLITSTAKLATLSHANASLDANNRT